VRDLETIIETLGDWAPKTSDLDVATEYVRNALRRTICMQHAGEGTAPGERPVLACVTLDPQFEARVESYIDRGAAGTSVNMPARVSSVLASKVVEGLNRVVNAGHPPVVIASPTVRAVVFQVVSPHMPGVAVLGYNEVVDDVEVQSLALITDPLAQPAGGGQGAGRAHEPENSAAVA
jgi:flagellar biosynthesis protein FlhA